MINFFAFNTSLKTDQQTRQFVGTGVTIIWVVILLVFALVPAVKSALDARAKIQLAEQYQSALADNLVQINQAKNLYNQQKEKQILVDQAAPSLPKSVSFVNELDLALATNGLTTELLDYEGHKVLSSKKKQSQLKEEDQKTVIPAENSLGFSVKARGNYVQIRNFLTHLENIPRVMQIERIAINHLDSKELSKLTGGSLEDSTVSEMLRLVVLGTFYFQP